MRRKIYQTVADEFWATAGGPPAFPCQLESPVLWTLPVAVVKLPRLWVFDVEAWLRGRGIQLQFGAANRPLHGSLIAYQGRGCIFLNGTDNDSELRYSLAHETAHFLISYLRPRRKAVSILGSTILDVFDGLRPPTVSERVHGILGHVPIGFHIHFMERDINGTMEQGAILEVEDQADRLALEIISPEEEVRARVARSVGREHHQSRVEVAKRLLSEEFGLPSKVAENYARYLYPPMRPSSVQEWLRQKNG